ncbi:MAG: hypothetical protein AAF950_15410 [Pseudomonadota bacterium]
MLFTLIKYIFEYGPLIFAVGFLWPLMAQIIAAAGWTPPLGLSPLQAAAIPAFSFGLIAQVRGTWLWQR